MSRRVKNKVNYGHVYYTAANEAEREREHLLVSDNIFERN